MPRKFKRHPNKELSRIAALAEAKQRKIVELKSAYRKLAEKSVRLERFQKVTVGRELEMIRLKEEINTLLEKYGQPKKYCSPDRIKEERKGR